MQTGVRLDDEAGALTEEETTQTESLGDAVTMVPNWSSTEDDLGTTSNDDSGDSVMERISRRVGRLFRKVTRILSTKVYQVSYYLPS
jgi:hypothetical protein